ncbi:hypothetical protein D210916BOD24_18680 [Alteromonas sp. D210916BOD_24]|uniref:DUF2897 family protein n=1 Tax=Alteromonas sp. D210916BOD_24 TaxID=3157618 RepID=UPI00399CC73E
MDLTWVIVIIVLVLGVVIGNITLLKYSAKFKFPTPSKPFDEVEKDAEASTDKTTQKKQKANGFDDEEPW